MTAGIATSRPMAVVTSASAIPPATAARPVAFSCEMPLNAFRMPTTVPNSPTNGAVDPMVARPPSPRFSSACTIASVRSRARLEASMVSPGISPGLSWWALNSIKPAVTTFARWLFLLRSATLMASSILPSRRAPATAGANARDCLRAALNAIQRSIITPIDHPDMMNRMMTTIFARIPIDLTSEIRSQPTWPSWTTQAAIAGTWCTALARLATNMSCFSSSGTRHIPLLRVATVLRLPHSPELPPSTSVPAPAHRHRDLSSETYALARGRTGCIRRPFAPSPATGKVGHREGRATNIRQPPQPKSHARPRGLAAGQREIHLNLRFHGHRLAIQHVRPVPPLLHGLDRRGGQHRVSADQPQVLNRAVLADFRLQQHGTLDPRLAGQRRIIRLHFLDQKSPRNAQRHPHALRSRDVGHGHRRRADNAADYAAHLSARNAARNPAHHPRHRSVRRWRVLFFDDLDFLGNLGGGAQLTVDQIALDLFHHPHGRCGRRWRRWRRRRRHQECHELLLGQRFGENERKQDQHAYQQRLQDERKCGGCSALRFQPVA